jgi:hypothetical protein
MTLELRVVNILGFFIESVSTGSIDGRIAHHPGLVNSSAPTLTHQSAFLRTAVLVR